MVFVYKFTDSFLCLTKPDTEVLYCIIQCILQVQNLFCSFYDFFLFTEILILFMYSFPKFTELLICLLLNYSLIILNSFSDSSQLSIF